jgi:hypothetical protein
VHAAVVAPGTVTLHPPLLDEDAVFYGVSAVGDPDGVFTPEFIDEDVIWQATVTAMGAELPPPLIPSDDEFHAPTVVSVYVVAPSHVASDDSFADGTLSPGERPLISPTFAEVDEFWETVIIRVGGDHVLLPSHVAADDSFYAPRAGAPRRSHAVRLDGSVSNRPGIAAVTGGNVLLEGDASNAEIELEGTDA